MQDTANGLLQALNALHNPSTDRQVRQQADQWLEKWQASIEAWSISDAVLHEPSSPLALQLFCSQTLRKKVQNDFEELPESAVATLRTSLADLFAHYSRGPSVVRTQLALAIAAMATHVPAETWDGGGVIPWFMQRMQSQPGEVALACMLELLIVLPQEARRHLPAVKPQRRRQIVRELAASTPHVLSLLSSCLTLTQEDSAMKKTLIAFAAWAELGGMSSLDGGELAQHPLVTASLAGLRDSDYFDEAVEAVVQLIYCSSAAGSPQLHLQPLVERLVPAVLQLKGRFSKALAHALKAGPDEEPDEADTAKGLARMFVELAEAYCSLISTGASEYLQPVEAMLEVAAYPDAAINSMSFNFWGMLAHNLTTSFSPQLHGQANGQVGDAEKQQRLAIFRPAFSNLVEIVRGHCRYPDNWRELDRSERSDFKRARYYIGDTITDAAGVLGGDATLKLLLEPLNRVGAGENFDWQTAEASLFCIRSVSRAPPKPGDPLLLQLFSSLTQLPAVPQLQYTSAQLTGAYADWLAASVQAGCPAELVAGLVKMLIAGLSNGESAPGASSSLRLVCESCGAYLGPAADDVLAALQRCQNTGPTQQSGSSVPQPGSSVPQPPELRLQERYVLQVVEAAAYLVAHMPLDRRKAVIAGILRFITQPLQSALEQNNEEAVVLMADRLTVVFRHVADPGAICEALQQAWPMLETAIQRCSHSVHAVEQLCRVPRYALRTCGPAAAVLLPTVADALPRWYSATHNPGFLYVASELLKVFGKEQQHTELLGRLFAQLVLEACSTLTTLSQCDDAPDTTDDTFLLAASGLQHCPCIVLQPQVLPSLLASAAVGVLVQHRDACGSVHSFVKRLFSADTLARLSAEDQKQWQAHTPAAAPVLIRRLLAGLLGFLPYSVTEAVPDVIFAILKAGGQGAAQILGHCIAALPAEAATQAEQQKAIQTATQLVSGGFPEQASAQLDDALQELASLCRRNPRAMKATEHALVPELLVT